MADERANLPSVQMVDANPRRDVIRALTQAGALGLLAVVLYGIYDIVLQVAVPISTALVERISADGAALDRLAQALERLAANQR